MLAILFHSSKTMLPTPHPERYQAPHFLSEAAAIVQYIRGLPPSSLQTSMKISTSLAEKTHQVFTNWSDDPTRQTAAIDVFRGDMYSGLRAAELTPFDRRYANDHLYILSGLYGILHALDSIAPYRLEMGYRLPTAPYDNLYNFWGKKLADGIPADATIFNLSSIEYTKTISPYVARERIITPRFLTRDPRTQIPKFVAVHAKIARGALAHYLIVRHAVSVEESLFFHDLGYHYDAAMSSAHEPTFICDNFLGTGLSIRKK
ncbi:MAG TPA: YaaA family protein [Candidatus Saccharimonadaceae bacterium]|nr:YaaA family protein [Candidatus Saccharimonadaceae bacterium]